MIATTVFLLIIFLVLSSGSIFCAAKFGTRYEEILPITCCAVVLILFFFGMAGILKAGVYAVCLAAAGLYALTFKANAAVGGRPIRDNVFTPAAVVFAIVVCVLFYINYGRCIAYADEFTHWADCVKAMVYSDLFYTEKTCNVVFAPYPPGMALMQYFFQKVFMVVSRSNEWNDWVLYLAYQIFMLSFFFPFLRWLSVKRIVRSAACVGLLLFSPLLMDGSSPFTNLMIDPFLSVAFGCMLAAVCTSNKDAAYDWYMCFGCAVLVLAKSAGLLLAVCIMVIYCLDAHSHDNDNKVFMKKLCGAAASVCVPKILWSIEVARTNAVQLYAEKTGAIDPKMLISLVLHKGGDSWQQIIHDEYYKRLLLEPVRIKGFQCPYVLIFAGACVIIYAGTVLLSRNNPKLKAVQKTVLPVVILFSAVYFVSVCYMYIFKFDHFEAIELHSFNRYVGIMLYGVYTAAVCVLCCVFLNCRNAWWVTGVALAAFIVLTPMGETIKIAGRNDIEHTRTEFPQYRLMSERVIDITGNNSSRVSLICQGSGNVDFFILHYMLRPNSTVQIGKSFIGPSPEPGIADRMLTADEWMQELRENYDYLAVFRLDDYFIENYSTLFAPGSEPEEGAVYTVSANSLLTKVS